jgi:hypothetical protein
MTNRRRSQELNRLGKSARLPQWPSPKAIRSGQAKAKARFQQKAKQRTESLGAVMPVYKAPVDEVVFLLSDVFRLDRYNNLPGFGEATPDVIEAVLAEAAR